MKIYNLETFNFTGYKYVTFKEMLIPKITFFKNNFHLNSEFYADEQLFIKKCLSYKMEYL